MEGQMDKQEARRKSVFAEQRGQKAFSTAFCKQENFPAELLRGVTKKGHEIIDVEGLVVCRRGRSKGTLLSHQETTEDSDAALANVHQTSIHGSQPTDQPQNQAEGVQPPSVQADLCSLQTESGILQPEESCFLENLGPEDLLSKLPESDSEGQRLLALCTHLKELAAERVKDGNISSSMLVAAESLHSMLTKLMTKVKDALGHTLITHETVCTTQKQAEADALQAKLLAMRGSLEAYRKEEAEWLELQGRLKSGTLLEEAVPCGAIPAIDETSSQDAAYNSLQAAASKAHKSLSFQVLGLESMVSGIELFKRKAEDSCTEMQAEYHAEKFRTSAHVDSPARLIHEIVRARGMRALKC